MDDEERLTGLALCYIHKDVKIDVQTNKHYWEICCDTTNLRLKFV